MNRFIRCAAVLVCAALLVSCSQSSAGNSSPGDASSGGVSESTQSSDKTLTLPFTPNDSLNPYTAKSKNNQELALLMYDPLVKTDNSFNTVNCLAKEIVDNSDSLTVTLSDAYFSDSSPLTADDVVYSVNRIKESADCRYFERISYIKSVSAVSSNTVRFTFTRKCEMNVYCLMFPIIKSGTAGLTDSDNKSIPPVGCGRYVFNNSSAGDFLSANENWHLGTVGIKKIALSSLPDDTAVSHALQSGGIDIYYSDLTDNTLPSLLGGVSHNVMRNNLTYLGVGRYSSLKSNKSLRFAVNAAIDRTDITDNAYFGQATAAAGPYHSAFNPAQGLQLLSAVSDKTAAAQYLAEAGYNTMSGGFYTKNGSPLSLTLIYNTENTAKAAAAKLISDQLSSAGIKCEVKSLSYDSYVAAISSGSCDLYIAEIKLDSLFDLYPVITAGGIISYSDGELNYTEPKKESSSASSASDVSNASGTPSDTSQSSSEASAESLESYTSGADTAFSASAENQKTALQAAYSYYTGSGSMSEMLSCFNSELPFIPLCHHSAVTVCTAQLEGMTPNIYDPFCGIENAVLR